jgi:prepilin-type N-terminal cleavage/methylation domain-containing protein
VSLKLKSDESGFTLVELLVAMAILGIIIPAIGAALISIIHNTNATNQRFAESHDAQITAAYFANDVQSVAVTGTVTPGSASYDTACDRAGDTSLIEFKWWQYDTTGSISSYNLVVYSTEPVSGSLPPVQLLRRRFCQGPNGITPSLVTDVVAGHLVSGATPPAVCTSRCAGQPANAVAMSVTESSGYLFVVSGVGRATG